MDHSKSKALFSVSRLPFQRMESLLFTRRNITFKLNGNLCLHCSLSYTLSTVKKIQMSENKYYPIHPRKGHIAQHYSLRTANFSGGKAFRVLIDLTGYGHCIYLLLIESLIMIPSGKRRSTIGFPVKLNFSRASKG